MNYLYSLNVYLKILKYVGFLTCIRFNQNMIIAFFKKIEKIDKIKLFITENIRRKLLENT